VAKRLNLLHELVPSATMLGFLANPTNPNIKLDTSEVQAAADALGLQLRIFSASTERELETAFDGMARQRVGALLVGVEPWFRSQPERRPPLAARHTLPANYERRDYVMAGGLMSYGTDLTEQWRLVGTYTGRILMDEKPADLPVYQATKFEFVLNLKTAKALGLEVSPTLLARADEVIE